MQGDSSSTSRPGGSSASSSAGSTAGAAGTGSAGSTGGSGTSGTSGTGGTGGTSGAAAGRSAGRSAARGATYGGSAGGAAYGAGAHGDASYGDATHGEATHADYDSEAESRLAHRRVRALQAANEEERGRTMAFGAGVAVGALLGAGLALLLAPQSGRDTRAVIARGARRIPERARDGWDDLGDELRSALRRRTKGARRGMRSARWKAADMMEG